ncbi:MULTISPECIES: DUF2301 domain-containing membrane protein [unclassified Agarivorans]|uniref:DUF2301 domain-containing membrane protein n=1 Tax=unclassified Agarivorans TaxID=2636026 RepID=UPI003D7D2708
MANTEHQENLDSIDKLSVLSYRLGWLVLAFAFAWAAYSGIYQHAIRQPLWLLAAACSLLAHNLHIYSKSIRYLVQACGWAALWLSLLFYLWHWPLLASLAMGAFYVVVSALVYKESFCFDLGLLRWLPTVLLADWLIYLSPWSQLRLPLLCFISIGCVIIAYQKLKQPLHFDIGKRSNYQL